MVHKKFLL